MIQISDDAILRGVKKRTTYDKGLTYFYAKRVNDFSFNNDSLHAEAVVYGSSAYKTKVIFNHDGSIKAYGCTCPFNESYTGFCKHTVATLKRAQEYCLSESIRAKQAQKNINALFSHFDRISDSAKIPLRLELTLYLERDYSFEGYSASFEFKIGAGRAYVVKNVKGFICSYLDEVIIQFGKNFTFDPGVHCFNNDDMKIIEIIEEGYHTDIISAAHSTYYRAASNGILEGKTVHLTDHSAKRLMDALQHRGFSAVVLGTDYSGVEIRKEPLPINFKLSGNDETLELEVTAPNNVMPKCIPITRDGEYVFFDGSIYHLEENQRKYVLPFLHYLLKGSSNTIPFTNQARQRFISDILPYSRRGLRLDIDSGLKEKFLNVDLHAEAYLDKLNGDIVTCKVEFKYGDITVEPFSHSNTYGDMILLRDLEKENEVISLLEQAEFKVGKEYLFFDDIEKIINFVVNFLPRLQQLADVFYSAAFREFKVADKRKLKAGIGYNSGHNLLEITFDFEGAESEELKDIFLAIREKRKYFKLKSGTFLPLHEMDLENVSNVLAYTEMSDHNPHISENGVIQVPVSRALYLNSELDDSKNLSVFRQTEFTRLVDNLKNPEEMEFTIPDRLDSVLRDYQKIGFQWLKTLSYYGLGGILADDMGLGKTLQTIAFVQSELADNPSPALVVAPTSLVYNWQDEINRFAPSLRVLIISGVQQTRQALLQEVEQSDIVLTSYPLLRRDIDLYDGLSFSYCFLDEAQHIKNPDSVSAKSVKQIHAKGYFALTGTPIENSLTEMWSIFDFVMPGFLLSHSKFLSNYERPIIKDHDEKVMKQLVKQIRPFILRRMKKDVLKELPEKIETKMTAELTDEQKKLYLAYLENAKGEIAAEIQAVGYERSQIKILAALTRLRQICCHPSTFVDNYNGDSGKMLLLQEIVSDAVESGHRILIFSQFTSMLSIISKYLQENQIDYFYLDGSTKAEDRHDMVGRFNDGENPLFLISLKAGGTGLNLTGADMVIHYDPWWNPAVEDQATDRAYRIGQQNVVQVFKLVTKGTIEEKIFAIQQQKKEIADAVIQPGETMINKLDPREIKALFDLV